MDTHLLIKIIHMSSVSLAIVVLLLRATTLFVGTVDNQPNPKRHKLYVGLQHLSFTLIVVTGVILLTLNSFQVQPWFYAKVVLFFVILSSVIKTYKVDPSIPLPQRKAGLFITTVAFIAIIGLIMIKPNFG